MMQPCYWDDMKNLDELGLDQNKLGKGKLSFNTSEGPFPQEKNEEISEKKANLIRRIIQAACFCSKER
ncbi:uncharacterized protein TNCV_4311211 [Trichonephila clavipes]|nr:uncharacterized protein TNCV_4311211 [Trichonephila clavipes]